jgi:hypothetical protein
MPASLQTNAEFRRYFSGKTIKCLLCRRRFQRLASHLAYKHDMTAAEYKSQFNLPWTRGLTSAASHQNAGWTARRRAKAKALARQTRFFEFAHPTNRRASPTYVQKRLIKNLGDHAIGFGRHFEQRVKSLFERGFLDREISQALGVNRMTVNQRTRKWRRLKKR